MAEFKSDYLVLKAIKVTRDGKNVLVQPGETLTHEEVSKWRNVMAWIENESLRAVDRAPAPVVQEVPEAPKPKARRGRPPKSETVAKSQPVPSEVEHEQASE